MITPLNIQRVYNPVKVYKMRAVISTTIYHWDSEANVDSTASQSGVSNPDDIVIVKVE